MGSKVNLDHRSPSAEGDVWNMCLRFGDGALWASRQRVLRPLRRASWTPAARPPKAGDDAYEKGPRRLPPAKTLRPSGRQDLNLRPLDPQSSALPSCATSRPRPPRMFRVIAQVNPTSHARPDRLAERSAPGGDRLAKLRGPGDAPAPGPPYRN